MTDAVAHRVVIVGGRAERTITIRQVIGRVAIEEAGGDEFTRRIIAARDPGSG